jgi:hypothetical protein
MSPKWLRDYQRLVRQLERQEQLIREALGPTAVSDETRRGVELLQDIERQQATEKELRAALPSGLATEALGRSYLAAEDFWRTTSHIASANPGLEVARRNYSHFFGATAQSAMLAAALQTLSTHRESPSLEALDALGRDLSLAARDVYADFALNPSAFSAVSESLREAPAIAIYSTTRSIAVVEGGSPELLEEHEDVGAEGALQGVEDELEARLRDIDPAFADAYRGALDALQTQGPDWWRHVGTSLRELTDHLIKRFAPDQDLKVHWPNPGEDLFSQGEFKRKAQLTFIYRKVAVGSYAKMGEKHIDVTQAIFYPANDLVHHLHAPLTPQQVRVFTRQVQGCLWMLIEAAEG